MKFRRGRNGRERPAETFTTRGWVEIQSSEPGEVVREKNRIDPDQHHYLMGTDDELVDLAVRILGERPPSALKQHEGLMKLVRMLSVDDKALPTGTYFCPDGTACTEPGVCLALKKCNLGNDL